MWKLTVTSSPYPYLHLTTGGENVLIELDVETTSLSHSVWIKGYSSCWLFPADTSKSKCNENFNTKQENIYNGH